MDTLHDRSEVGRVWRWQTAPVPARARDPTDLFELDASETQTL
jgi:hypothetical protein